MTEPEARLDKVRLRHPPIGDELEDVVKMLQEGFFLFFLDCLTTLSDTVYLRNYRASLHARLLRRSHSDAP